MSLATVLVLVIILAILYRVLVHSAPPLIEKLSRVATKEDQQDALRAFFKVKCEKQGHRWSASPDGSTWDCHYSSGTCDKNSYWPEISAEKDPRGIARMYQYWNAADEKCYLGYGALREKCEELGLQWNHNSQQCRVTPQYCKDKLLMYKDGDCYKEPISWLNEKIFGKTLGRAMSMVGISGIIRAVNWGENGVL